MPGIHPTEPTPGLVSAQRASAFLVHFVRGDADAYNAVVNDFADRPDEVGRFIGALAAFAVSAAKELHGGEAGAMRWAEMHVRRFNTDDAAWSEEFGEY